VHQANQGHRSGQLLNLDWQLLDLGLITDLVSHRDIVTNARYNLIDVYLTHEVSIQEKAYPGIA
jgi:hypothetical protein